MLDVQTKKQFKGEKEMLLGKMEKPLTVQS